MDTIALPDHLTQFTEAPSTYSDLLRRPSFRTDVDPKLNRLAEVLTPYTFGNEVPCGLTTCHQGHLHGFLVRTTEGHETNIGHVCGRNHFGEDFDIANATYRRNADRRDAVNQILALQERAPAVRQQVTSLVNQQFGVRWVYHLMGCLNRRIGAQAYAYLITRAKREDMAVTRVSERSEEDILRLMRDTGKKRDQVRYIEEQVGRLPSMKWLYWDFKNEVVAGVDEAFRLITEVDPNMETKRLKDASKLCFGWDVTLRTAQAHLEDAMRFLAADNLEIAHVAVEEFLRDKTKPDTPWSLKEWAETGEARVLMRGDGRTVEPVITPVKQVSKGKLRKRKRR
ncbi:hypothetical protein [Ottowia thiooxydans]|uniref:hypothetical protein n=1 Tax=Ottowia thiooxydans TaxID=219182 RepID=UPI00040E473C|nr:hypothetical protein [Ottowia thiooxydans]